MKNKYHDYLFCSQRKATSNEMLLLMNLMVTLLACANVQCWPGEWKQNSPAVGRSAISALCCKEYLAVFLNNSTYPLI